MDVDSCEIHCSVYVHMVKCSCYGSIYINMLAHFAVDTSVVTFSTLLFVSLIFLSLESSFSNWPVC